MSKRRWTIIIVPQGSSTSRVFEVSQATLQLGASLLVGAGLIALLLGYGTVTKSLDLSRARALETENAHLADQLGVMHGRLGSLTDTLADLERRDTQLRLLANLDPIDPQVRAAGIGGPAPAEAAETESGVLLQRSAQVRVDLSALIRRANLLAASFREAGDSLAAHSQRLSATPSIWPTEGWLTSAFARARAHPILHFIRPHEGIDVTAPMGAPIAAPANGTVARAGWEAGYGNVVVIEHGYGIVTKFAHISRILVRKGQWVSRGQRIALVGSTGLATGPHLHYEVLVNGRPVDPLKYILPSVITD